MMKQNLCPLYQAALRFPQKTAVISGPHKITYTQLSNTASDLQTFFKMKGVMPQMNVAVVGANSLEYIIVLFALWRIGATACLLNPRIPTAEIKIWLNKLKCTHIICDTAFDANLPAIRFNEIKKILSATQNKESLGAGVVFSRPATIMLTSGSTAQPKAAVHSLNNHIFNALGSNDNIRLKPDHRWLISLPLYHVSGLSIVFRTILSGATMVLMQSQDELPDIFKKQKITHVSFVTTQWSRLLQSPRRLEGLKQLKAILLGGSGIPQKLLLHARALKLSVYTSYGLTEMASQVATTPHPCYMGKVLPQAKILKYRRLKVSREGKIFVKGKTLFLGYYNKGKIDKSFLKSGWFATGDLGSVDKNGYLSITGREDNMFISGGENIQPEEIEKTLLSFPMIEQAVVVPHPDKEFGELPVAFIKFSTQLSSAALMSFLNQRLPRFKIPKKIFLWPENFSKTSLKINRQQLKKIILTSQISLKQLS